MNDNYDGLFMAAGLQSNVVYPLLSSGLTQEVPP